MLETYRGNVYSNGGEKIDDKTVMMLSYSASLSNRYVAPFYYDSFFKHYVYNTDISTQETRRNIEFYSMLGARLCSCLEGISDPSDGIIGIIDTNNGPKIRV